MHNSNFTDLNLAMMPAAALSKAADCVGLTQVVSFMERNPIISAIAVNILAGMALSVFANPIVAAVVVHVFGYASLVQWAISQDPTRTVQEAFGY